jgi:glycosyltransferase involved in cell wall biosynthesis
VKVLYLTNIPAPYRIDFFNELGKYCDLTVLLERKTSNDRLSLWHGRNYVNFKPIFLKGISIGSDGAFCPSVEKFIKKNKFDIFIIGGYSTPTGMFAIEIFRLRRIPFFLNCDGGMIKKDNIATRLFKNHFIRSASYFFSSGLSTDVYLKHYGAKEKNIFHYNFSALHNNDILRSILTEKEKRKIKLSLEVNSDQLVLAVGRFIPLKRFDVLIKAWKSVNSNITLMIIGEGEERKKYETLIEKLLLKNVKLVNYKHKKELTEYYKAADLLVHPSSSEAWGLVINEAMACGLPVITTNKCLAGLELIKDNENGFIVPVDNQDILIEKINTILNDDKLKKKMAINNLERIKSYTIEKMAIRHFSIFRKVLPEKAKSVKKN